MKTTAYVLHDHRSKNLQQNTRKSIPALHKKEKYIRTKWTLFPEYNLLNIQK